ncbi:MAG TPA: formyltransferase family protein [Candidatus Thermoplasmatota archaeon]|nr:formyltransferase family protein [Candidatus Thermoplasmatota archaeon]
MADRAKRSGGERASVVANLSVTGKDRTGVVARFTSYLFENGANIEAIEERVRRGEFHMLLQAGWDAAPQERKLARELRKLGDELGMEVRFRVHQPGAARKAALFVTKEPHALDAVMRAVRAKRLKLDPRFVLGTRKDLAKKAEEYGLPFHYVSWKEPARGEARALKLCDDEEIDLIVLARFMRILSPGFVWKYPNRIVNVHPSLLPAFPGASAYRQAWEHGVRVAGATAHFVTPDLDQGPILAQKAFTIPRNATVDEIRARGQEAEADVLVEALEMCVREDLDVHWGRVW